MVGIGGDHNGFELKQRLCALLRAQGHGVLDFGAREGETADYPDIAASVAQAVATGNVDRGILVCGSGLGMAIAANKVPGIRAATVHDTYTARSPGSVPPPRSSPWARGSWARNWPVRWSLPGWRRSSRAAGLPASSPRSRVWSSATAGWTCR